METILVPTDFSPVARNATNYAVELAKFFEAKLILVHAFALPSVSQESLFPFDSIETLEKISLKKLKELRSELLIESKQYLDIEYFVEPGSTYDLINVTSIKHHVDLIVMGIVGEAGRIKEHVIGSLSIRIARHLEVPTFIIPEGVKYQPIHRISFACDMDETEKTQLVDIVKCFSKMFDAEVEIINIEKPEEEITYEKARTSLLVERKLEDVKHKTIYVTEKSIAKGIEDYLELHSTDVIILNPKKHNIFHALFKENVAKGLAFHIHIPILAIH